MREDIRETTMNRFYSMLDIASKSCLRVLLGKLR